MSNFQFQKYEQARVEERLSEKRSRSSNLFNKVYDNTEQSSTYRIFSRLFCNFVMPDRPMPGSLKFSENKQDVNSKKKSSRQGEKEEEKQEEKP
jgi:hypothetical protein